MRPRDAFVRELLDADEFDDQTLASNLADMRRINALLGWTTYTARTVLSCVQRAGLSETRVLDVASGSADIPLAIARRAARSGLAVQVHVTDISPQIVRIAAARAAAFANVHVERQNALALDYPDESFDIGMCTLALHHFDPEQAVTLLTELRRVSRCVMVFDVLRARAAYYGAWLMTRLLRMHAMTCHDAPVSVLRAYTVTELRQMAYAAKLPSPVVRVAFPFRLVLTSERERSTN